MRNYSDSFLLLMKAPIIHLYFASFGKLVLKEWANRTKYHAQKDCGCDENLHRGIEKGRSDAPPVLCAEISMCVIVTQPLSTVPSWLASA